jgi:hypothetical protein
MSRFKCFGQEMQRCCSSTREKALSYILVQMIDAVWFAAAQMGSGLGSYAHASDEVQLWHVTRTLYSNILHNGRNSCRCSQHPVNTWSIFNSRPFSTKENNRPIDTETRRNLEGTLLAHRAFSAFSGSPASKTASEAET